MEDFNFNPLSVEPIQTTLLIWYENNARDLPWRHSRDPYHIWVSEIMLQQTRVETVIPYYLNWMRVFPNLQALASASEQDVLKHWEGLGYYSRARNLHKAARIILNDLDNQFPKTGKDLKKLPGIGEYTAGAILSIAFNQPQTALDGNIKRVLARLFAISKPVYTPAGKKLLADLAEQLLPVDRPGDFNQAMMDLGASICLPRNPKCGICPVEQYCKARLTNSQYELPVLKEKKAVPHKTVTAAVLLRNKQVLIAQRPDDQLLGGLWEFPGGTQEKDENLQECLKREIKEELGIEVKIHTVLGEYKHAFTHFRITLHAFLCSTIDEPQTLENQQIRWVSLQELEDYPMGKVDRQISRDLNKVGIQSLIQQIESSSAE